MDRECPKCGFVNAAATGSAIEVCPQCAVIYSKASLAIAQERVAARQIARRDAAKPGVALPVVETVLWWVAIVGALGGVVQLAYTVTDATSAIQQAAGAGVAVAMAVIPYCLARSVQARRRR